MKKLLFISGILFFFIINLNAQKVFTPSGAEWHYKYNFLGTPTSSANVFNENIKYERDSILGNDTVKVLKHRSFFIECTNHDTTVLTLIKQGHDTVYMQNNFTRNFVTNTNKWEILYIYSASPGQFWITKIKQYSSVYSYTATVNSVDSVLENTIYLKRLNVTYNGQVNSNNFTYNTIITERFGARFLFPFYFNLGSCDADYLDKILCYTDSTFGFKQFTTLPCDYSYHVGLTDLNDINEEIKTFPNPVNDLLNIDTEIPFTKIEIINSLGQIVKTEELVLNNNKTSINTKDLPEGFYLLNFTALNSQTLSKRFVISH